MEFTSCVGDTERVLQGLCQIADIEYPTGSFDSFEDAFCNSNLVEDFFVLESELLKVSVHLEKYEGYFFVTISGSGTKFELAKKYLLSNEAST